MNKVYTHCFDDGHGGGDPGALGERGSHESIIALAIGKIAGRIMIEQGQKVVYTRTTDKYLTLAQRADIANKASCDTFTSIHCNSNKGVPGHGTETYSHPFSTNGLKLSKCVQSEMIKATGLTDRGCKTANYGVLRMTKAVAILVETAFINNPGEEILLMQDEFREKVALAIVKGIFNYLGLEFKTVVVKNTTTEKPYQERNVRGFQTYYNEITKTTSPLVVDGVYGKNTLNAYEIIGKLIRGEY